MDIEDKIRQNRYKFEATELPEGYLRNFEKKLTRPRNRMIIRMISLGSTAAAAIVLVTILLHSTPEMSENEKKMAEIETYYQNRHQKTLDIIEQLLEKSDPQTRRAISSELLTMQLEDAEFRKQRRQIMGDERYLAFEVQYYNTRQQSLEYIQTILTK